MKTFSESAKKIHHLEKQVEGLRREVESLNSELTEARQSVKSGEVWKAILSNNVEYLETVLKVLLEDNLLQEILMEQDRSPEKQHLLKNLKKAVQRICLDQVLDPVKFFEKKQREALINRGFQTVELTKWVALEPDEIERCPSDPAPEEVEIEGGYSAYSRAF